MTTFEAIAGRFLNAKDDAVQMIVNGVNKSLRVQSGDRDVHVRFSPISLHSREDLEAEAAFLLAMNSQREAVRNIMVTADKNILGPLTISGEEYNGLMTFTIEGEQLTVSTDNAREFGRSLALVHSTDVQISDSAGPDLSSSIEVSPLLFSVYGDLLKLQRELEAHVKDPIIGICHGDAWVGNAISRNGQAVLFDFEFWGKGSVAYDIGTFAWNLHGQGLGNSTEIFAAFVAGYRSVYDIKIAAEEIILGAIRREINNIHFMTKHISMSRDIKIAVSRMAKDTLQLAALNHPLFVWE